MGSVGGNGFKNGWEDAFPGWQAIRGKIFEFQESTKLQIVILGPGKGHTQGFEKRSQIRDRLDFSKSHQKRAIH